MQSMLSACLSLAAVLAIGAPCRAADADATRVDRLIQQLGSDQFAQREAASRALEAIGAPAFAALRDALGSDDAEVRRRAENLVERLRPRLHAQARTEFVLFVARLRSKRNLD
jgi:hypothetical protein